MALSRKAQEILAATAVYARPEPLPDVHPITPLLKNLGVDDRSVASGPALGWAGRDVARNLFDNLEPAIGSLLAAIPKARAILQDDRMRADVARQVQYEGRVKALQPEFNKVCLVVANEVTTAYQRVADFRARILEVSGLDPAKDSDAIIRELQAQEVRRFARQLADAGLIRERLTIPALESERFEVVQALADCFPALPGDLDRLRFDWATAKYPALPAIVADLETIAGEIFNLGFAVVGLCRVACDRLLEPQEIALPAGAVETQLKFAAAAARVRDHAGKVAHRAALRAEIDRKPTTQPVVVDPALSSNLHGNADQIAGARSSNA